MDVLESEFGVKDSYLDLVKKDFYLLALNLIEYVNNELQDIQKFNFIKYMVFTGLQFPVFQTKTYYLIT